MPFNKRELANSQWFRHLYDVTRCYGGDFIAIFGNIIFIKLLMYFELVKVDTSNIT